MVQFSYRIALCLCLLILAGAARACPTCRPQVQAGIYNGEWGANVAALLLPLVVIGAAAIGLYFSEPLAARWRGRS